MKKVLVTLVFIVIVIFAGKALYEDMQKKYQIDESLIYSEEYTSLYYYNQLTAKQKEYYIKIDTCIKKLEQDIHFGFAKNADVKKDVSLVLSAIYNDRPEYFYLPQDYNVKSLKVGDIEYTYLRLKYTVKSIDERDRKTREMNRIIDSMISSSVTDEMTDFEKELALHDALMNKVEYLVYEKIETIPQEQHTAYEAFVNNSGVCDGMAKAYMMLLNKVGIETIMVTGKIADIAHAWNIVKLDGEYYHVDPTSDTVEISEKTIVMHRYFNLSDNEIFITHILDKEFEVPKCTGTKYNYYLYKSYYIDYIDNLRTKVVRVVNAQWYNEIIEIKLDSLYSHQKLIEELYYLNFNNWNKNYQSAVTYHKLEDVFIFENKNK